MVTNYIILFIHSFHKVDNYFTRMTALLGSQKKICESIISYSYDLQNQKNVLQQVTIMQIVR